MAKPHKEKRTLKNEVIRAGQAFASGKRELYLDRNEVLLAEPTVTDKIVIILEHSMENCPATLNRICCYSA